MTRAYRPAKELWGLAWLAVVVALGVHQVHLWRHTAWDTDMLALLPQAQPEDEAAAVRALLASSSQDVLVLVGAATWEHASAAADAFVAQLQSAGAPLIPNHSFNDPSQIYRALDLYRPYRQGLLTAEQAEMLQRASPEELRQRALETLYQPAYSPKLSTWLADPLGLWPQWWQARLQQSPVRLRQGRLALHTADMEFVLLPYTSTQPSFSLGGQALLATPLQAARTAALQAAGDATVLMAGIPLHAEAASVQASWEVNTIGVGSLLAVLALVWLAFHSLWPMGLVALSLAIGCAAGLSTTVLVFGRIHVVTLVFGASLVGVAEDYGIHYFCSRQRVPRGARWRMLVQLLPGLSLALATSVLGYLCLGVAPFPGLRQMAVFSAAGLMGAFATVCCWFPWLDMGAIRATAFSNRLALSLGQWPRWQRGRASALVTAMVAGFLAIGLARLRSNDDIRILQSSPEPLMQAQRRIGTLLGLASPAQFFVVDGPSPEAVLQSEESLKKRLLPLQQEGALSGVRAVSDWLPSAARRRANTALTHSAETTALQAVGAQLGEELHLLAAAAAPLDLNKWLLAFGAAGPSRGLWVGKVGDHYESVVQLCGLRGPGDLAAIEAAARPVAGVHWTNKTAQLSELLRRYRLTMAGLLVAGHGAVFGALVWRFGRRAWRAMLPTLLASVVTLACLGWLGQPVHLFVVLALLLVLGTGVDYGIFLLEDRGDGAAWVAIMIGAASTWLSFGLLALSQTPSLRAFGLTMMLGIGTVWLVTPCFRPGDPS